MSSGITTSRDVSVTDASNVNKHDRLYSREMGSIKIPIVDSVNYGTNVVTVGNDYSLLTLSDKEPVVFRRNKDPKYAAKMRRTMDIVRKRLGKNKK